MNAPSTPRKKRGAGFVMVIVVAIGFGVLCIAGILAAIAIPSFIQYTRRAKVAEARTNLNQIFTGIVARAETEGAAPVVTIPRTPVDPPCGQKALWPSDAPAEWAEIGFTPLDPMYYAYEIEAHGDGSFVVRAIGDLDCDGTLAILEQRGRVDPTTRVAARDGDIIATNELE